MPVPANPVNPSSVTPVSGPSVPVAPTNPPVPPAPAASVPSSLSGNGALSAALAAAHTMAAAPAAPAGVNPAVPATPTTTVNFSGTAPVTTASVSANPTTATPMTAMPAQASVTLSAPPVTALTSSPTPASTPMPAVNTAIPAQAAPAAPARPISDFVHPKPRTLAPTASADVASGNQSPTAPVAPTAGSTSSPAPGLNPAVKQAPVFSNGQLVVQQQVATPEPEVTPGEGGDKAAKKPDVMMIILSVILVVLVIIAGYLWWMNSQGKSVFGPQVAQNPVTPVTSTSPTPAPDAQASGEGQVITGADLCYVNPNEDGMQQEVERFVTWVNNSFADAPRGTDEYRNLFEYYLDRAYGAPDICVSHQQFCHIFFADQPAYVAQFAHYSQQREYQSQGVLFDRSTPLPARELRDLILIDFNLRGIDFNNQLLGQGTKSPNSWVYDPSNDTIMSFGDIGVASGDYRYEFKGAKWLDVTSELVLIGEGVAKETCKETNGCACQASKLYLYLQKGETNNFYFSDLFVAPEVGQFAPLEETPLYY